MATRNTDKATVLVDPVSPDLKALMRSLNRASFWTPYPSG
jgi:hypothetical protein